MQDLLDQWLEDPVANLNLLNQLVPALIQQFNTQGESKGALKELIGTIESIRDVLDERQIVTSEHYSSVLNSDEAIAQ